MTSDSTSGGVQTISVSKRGDGGADTQSALEQIAANAWAEAGTGDDSQPEGKTHYPAIFLSDIHLGTKDCQAELLLDFLKHHTCERLYLVGDIIDGWRLKKKFYWPSAHNDIVWRIMKRAKRGTRIVYIPGNHDEMFRQFTGLNFGGVEIRRAAFHDDP